MKKWLIGLLALALLLGTLAGCAPTAEVAPETPETPEETQNPETPAGEGDGEEIDYAALYQEALDTLMRARETYELDAVVLTVDGEDVTWDMYYYFLVEEIQSLLAYTAQLPEDFTEPLSASQTLEEYFRDMAVSKSKFYGIAYAKAAEAGVEVSEAAEADIQEYLESMADSYGGEDALAEAMAESCLDRELFVYLLRANELLTEMMEARHGADGEKLTEEEILDWAEDRGYIRVKHVLYTNFDDAGQPLEEDALAEQKALAEASLAELQDLAEDPEALETRFDEIMNADSGDLGGLMSFPAGYTFTEGTMYPVFEEAAFALEEYALSELVESQSGYHIILRLPMDPGGLTMDQDANTGAYMTLRQTAANELFSQMLAGWLNDAEVEWVLPEVETLDLNDLFGIVPPPPAETEE